MKANDRYDLARDTARLAFSACALELLEYGRSPSALYALAEATATGGPADDVHRSGMVKRFGITARHLRRAYGWSGIRLMDAVQSVAALQ